MSARIRRITSAKHGSTTPAGSVREWRVLESEYFGDGTPCMEPTMWHAPYTMQCYRSTDRGYFTERHALNMLARFDNERQRLDTMSAEESNRPTRGRIYTHPRVLHSHTSTDQSVAVGGSRSGQSAEWYRRTYTVRTRDGVTYTYDILAYRAGAPRTPHASDTEGTNR